MLDEHEARRRGVVAAVREAETAEKGREERLRRARTSRECRALEKRFRQERRLDAQRISDLNQERIDYLMHSFEPSTLERKRPQERTMPVTTVRDLTFYKAMYAKLNGRRRLPPIPETTRLRAVRSELVTQLEALVSEEDALTARPSTSSSSSSSVVVSAATAPDLGRPRSIPPQGMPRLRL